METKKRKRTKKYTSKKCLLEIVEFTLLAVNAALAL